MTPTITVKRRQMGRPIAKVGQPINLFKNINVGYGPGQLRPDGSRDATAEPRVMAQLVMIVNGMSGQLI